MQDTTLAVIARTVFVLLITGGIFLVFRQLLREAQALEDQIQDWASSRGYRYLERRRREAFEQDPFVEDPPIRGDRVYVITVETQQGEILHGWLLARALPERPIQVKWRLSDVKRVLAERQARAERHQDRMGF